MQFKPFIESALTKEVLGCHEKYIAEYTFAEGYPYGFAPEVIHAGTLNILATLGTEKFTEEGQAAVNNECIFNLLKKDVNSFEVEAVLAPKDYRLLRFDFSCGTKRNFIACQRLYKKAEEKNIPFAAVALSDLAESCADIQQTLPSFYNVQISSKLNSVPLYVPEKNFNTENMPLEKFAGLVAQIKDFSDDAVIGLSAFGEPLLLDNLDAYVAEVLKQFYEELKDVPADKLQEAVYDLIKRSLLEHKKIIFNGNGYSDEWVAEAKKRGLYNLKSTPEALPCFIAKKNVDLFTSHHIFTETEIHSRYEILLENYVKTLHIEAKTLQSMLRKEFLPALSEYCDTLTSSIVSKKEAASLPCTAETKLLTKLSDLQEKIYDLLDTLDADVATAEGISGSKEAADYYYETIIPDMDSIRVYADQAEEFIPDGYLPYPTYEELLFSV